MAVVKDLFSKYQRVLVLFGMMSNLYRICQVEQGSSGIASIRHQTQVMKEQASRSQV